MSHSRGATEDSDDDWVWYKDRQEWADLKPVKQNDGPNPVVKIAYSGEFVDVYDYFRGVVAVGELSNRALLLTEDAIDLNAANYTVWQYRRRILEHLNCDLEAELKFCRLMIEANPKNYQVWHHRRVVVGWKGDGADELSLTKTILGMDAKNYHAWEHRQWAVRTFGIYEDELSFIDKLLEEDMRNNSAWNHRYFVFSRTTGLTVDVLKKELDYTWRSIAKLQDNESPWSYVKGLLQDTSGDEAEIGSCWQDLERRCWGLVKEKGGGGRLEGYSKGEISSHLLIGLLDCLTHRIRDEEKDAQQDALKILELLATVHDVIRSRYWRYLSRELQTKHNTADLLSQC